VTRVIALLIVVCAAVNLPSLFPGFIQDDHPIVERNPAVNQPAHLPDTLTQGYWSVEKTFVNNLYRPVTLLSFALNRMAAGAGAFGYRLVNLALHILVTILVYVLARRIAGARHTGPARPESWAAAPALAALLFAVHPVHTEVLGMIVGRAELLAAAGVLGSVALFLAAREVGQAPRGAGGGGVGTGDSGDRRRRALQGLAIAAFVLGSLSKENAIVAPALILAADLLIVVGRPAWGFHAFAAIAAAAVVGLRVLVLGSFSPGGGTHFLDNPMVAASFLEGRLTALAAIPRYLEVLVFPWRLSVDYSYDALPIARSPADLRVLAGIAVIVAALGMVIRFRRRWPGLAYSVLWIGLAFAPVANLLVPIGTIMAERLIYLPSAGFCWAVGLVLDRLAERRPIRQPAARPSGTLIVVLSAAIFVGFGIRSEVRYLDWRDNHAIFASAVRVVPRSTKAHFNYGTACEERGDLVTARDAYEKAISIWPEFADAHYNLAGVLAKQRQGAEAVAHYREALRLEPFNVRYMVNLAVALSDQGSHAEARDLARRALEIDRDSDEAWTALGTAALALGESGAGVEAYGQALRIDPGRPIYLFNLALALERNGDIAGAIASYRRGLAGDPANAEMARGLAQALLTVGEAIEARQILDALVRAAPAHPIFRYQLGRALEVLGEEEAAIAAYREAARLAPDAPVPHRALGLILIRRGDRIGARAALERAAAADPEAWARDAEGQRLLDGLRAGRRPAPPG